MVISSQKDINNEVDIVIGLFQAGLKTFHLRKPGYPKRKIKNFIQDIPVQFHNRIVLHSYHELALKYDVQGIHFKSKDRKNKLSTQLKKWRFRRKKSNITMSASFHKLVSLDSHYAKYDYVFLSPIFDSITKKDYQSGFAKYNLKSALERTHFDVFALGGVDRTKIDEIQEIGFKGAVLNGYIWTSPTPIDAFKKFKEEYLK